MIVNKYSDIYKEDTSLRPYQKKAKREIFESWDEVDNVMFQMPTGTGKTRLFTSIIRDINDYSKLRKEPVKILIIAHRTELIDQIDESLRRYCVAHNVIAGSRGDRNYKYPVNVASIQTITNKNNLKDAQKLKVQFVIIDEAHHALAATYKKLWDMYPGSKKLGVTATPWRMNHQSFTDLFDKLVLSMPIKDFIKQGYLSAYKYFSLRGDTDIQKAIDDIELDRFGEYKESSMEEKMDIGSIRAQLLDSYLSLAEGKKGIIYAINIVHAKHICEEYKKAGYKAVSIDSKTPAAERKSLVNKFKQGEIDIIVNVDIFSEGFDCPDIEFIQLARPTRSLVKYLQQVGRGLRPTENKENCIILDNVGMYSRFGLPNARRHWLHHFLGQNVDEEVTGRGLLKGTGRTRFVDLSEGTEDMELIQEIETPEITPENDTSLDMNELFPLWGITPGKTTWKDAEDLGHIVEIWKKGPDRTFGVKGVDFWDHKGIGVFNHIYWVRHNSDFPESWKSKGFSWEKNYDEWISLFERYGYEIEIKKNPTLGEFRGKPYFDAEFSVISPDKVWEIGFDFSYGENGSLTSSPKTLYSISIRFHSERIIESETISTEKKQTINEYDVDRLMHVFSSKATSYKYFWFMSLMQIYKERHEEAIYNRDILIKMVANAWPCYFVGGGQFPSIDQLPTYLIILQGNTNVDRNAKREVVEEYVSKYYDSLQLGRTIEPLLKNVPYRFLSPWIPFTSNEDVIEKSCQPETRCLYELHNNYIKINDLWKDYLLDHYEEIMRFIVNNLNSYLRINIEDVYSQSKENIVEKGFFFLEDNGKTITGIMNNASGEIEIPEGVEKIEKEAFEDNTKITSVVCPTSLRRIEDRAFYGCKNLHNIILNEGLRAIGTDAFLDSDLDSVYLPSTVESLGYTPFECPVNVNPNNNAYFDLDGAVCDFLFSLIVYPRRRNNTLLELNSNVMTIEGYALEQNKAREIVLPEETKYLGSKIFNGCPNLKTLTIKAEKIKTLKEDTFKGFEVEECVLRVPFDVLSEYQSDERFKDFKYITAIEGSRCLKYNENGTEVIGCDDDECGDTIDIPDGVTSIKDGAFVDNENIRNVVFPETLTKIGNSAFAGCSGIYEIKFNEELEVIEYDAFRGTNLSKVNIPDYVNYIGPSSFTCEMKVERYNTDYADIEGVLYDFAETKLVIYPSNRNENKYDVVDDVEEIGMYAFEDSRLWSITFPETIRTLGPNIFEGCEELIRLTIHVEDPSEMKIDKDVFSGFNTKQCRLIVPAGCKAKYSSHEYFKEFMSIEEMNNGNEREAENKLVTGTFYKTIPEAKISESKVFYYYNDEYHCYIVSTSKGFYLKLINGGCYFLSEHISQYKYGVIWVQNRRDRLSGYDVSYAADGQNGKPFGHITEYISRRTLTYRDYKTGNTFTINTETGEVITHS